MLAVYRDLLIYAAAVFGFASVATAAADAHASAPSLYARLGGEAGVTAITADLVDATARDPVLGRSFAHSDLARVKRLLAEQICDLTGGGCRYTGDSMRDVHAGHAITEREFYAMVDILRATLRRHRVPLAARNELLALLAPMRRDIVERPAPSAADATGR